eukprot:Nk52_evm27s1737 gene=Nk52_evmTU27s1737
MSSKRIQDLSGEASGSQNGVNNSTAQHQLTVGSLNQLTTGSTTSACVPVYVEKQENYWQNVFDKQNQTGKPKSKEAEITIEPRISESSSSSKLEDIETHKWSESYLMAYFGLEDFNNGLSPEIAEARFIECGPNQITPKKEQHWLVHFLKCQIAGFSPLLLSAAVLIEIAYVLSYNDTHSLKPLDNLYLGLVLVFVSVFQGTCLFIQEVKSANVTKAILNMMPPAATVIRGGKQKKLEAKYLVGGDVVLLSQGDRVPADLRVIVSKSCKVDNSALTGESDPQHLLTTMTSENPLETHNLAFNGTMVMEGSAIGVVVACGDKTVVGKIARMVDDMNDEGSPLSKDLTETAHKIALTACVLGVLLLIANVIQGYIEGNMNWTNAIVLMCSYIVAIIPEGLPIANSTMLSIICKKMADKNVLVKSMPSVETLGCTTVLCSDKTGTLTQNKMSVHSLYADGIILDHHQVTPQNKVVEMIVKISLLCNKAVYSKNTLRTVTGDATETALLAFGEKNLSSVLGVTGMDSDSYREQNVKLAEIPFNSKNKYQVSVHDMDGHNNILMKGAPERILDRCTSLMTSSGEEISLTPEDRNLINENCALLAARGQRVLGCAYYRDSVSGARQFTTVPEPNFQTQSMCFVGLMALIDPPREDVPNAVNVARGAGIKISMVTGDHPLTAFAIAKEVNIVTCRDERPNLYKCSERSERAHVLKAFDHVVVTGEELSNFQEADWEFVLNFPEIVFARTSPAQKMAIVTEFQAKDNVVAVTGDGVNDSPALKKADIGIAMGITGSDVAKETADVILMDDNFSSIVDGIEQGRAIFENMRKAFAYMMGGNGVEFLPPVITMIIGIPQALSTFLMIVICCMTDMGPTLSLAWQSPDGHVMNQKPRNIKTERLFQWPVMYYAWTVWGLIVGTGGGYFAFFMVMDRYGFSAHDLMWCSTDFADDSIGATEYAKKYITRSDAQDFDYSFDMRSEAVNTAQTAYFVAAVGMQIFNIFAKKNRMESQFKNIFAKITGKIKFNWATWVGIFAEICVVMFMVYCPFINSGLSTGPLKIQDFWYGVPAGFILLCGEETKKYYMRKNPNGKVAKYTYP